MFTYNEIKDNHIIRFNIVDINKKLYDGLPNFDFEKNILNNLTQHNVVEVVTGTNIIDDYILEKLIELYPHHKNIRFTYLDIRKPPNIVPHNFVIYFNVKSYDLWCKFIETKQYLEFVGRLGDKNFTIKHLLACHNLTHLYIGATNNILFEGELEKEKETMNNLLKLKIKSFITQGYGIVKYDDKFNKIIKNIEDTGGYIGCWF